MFAVKPEKVAQSTGESREPGAPVFEAGDTRTLAGVGIEPVHRRPGVDPSIHGIELSDSLVHSGGVGGGTKPPKLAPNRPMTGQQADYFVNETEAVRVFVADQIRSGFTASRLLHFHKDRAALEDAAYRHSLAVATIYEPDLPVEKVDAMKRRAAHELARTSGGFTNPQTREMHVLASGIPPFVTIHELMHAYSNNIIWSMPNAIIEGGADFFTRIVCDRNSIPFVASYAEQEAAMKLLALAVGEVTFGNFFFKGAFEVLREKLDRLGRGTWARYRRALSNQNYAHAAAILYAAKGADSAHEMDEQRRMEIDDEQAAERERTRTNRSTWPEERQTPLSLRPVMKITRHNMEMFKIPYGGKAGLRETWKARFHLQDGTQIPAVITDVDDEATYVLFPGKENYEWLRVIELYPGAR